MTSFISYTLCFYVIKPISILAAASPYEACFACVYYPVVIIGYTIGAYALHLYGF